RLHCVEDREARADRTLGIVLPRVGPTEVHEQAVAHLLGDVAAPALDRDPCGLLVLPDDVAPILGVELLGEQCRADQVAEENGQLSAFTRRRGSVCRRGAGYRRERRRQLADGPATFAAKLLAPRILRAAVRATMLQCGAAVAAKSLAGGVLAAAVVTADHGIPLAMVIIQRTRVASFPRTSSITAADALPMRLALRARQSRLFT